MKIDNLDITELSYLDALNILKRDLKAVSLLNKKSILI